MGLAIRILLTGWLCLQALGPASALDPSRSIVQYKHTKWTVDNGNPGNIVALAQDRRGYLWLGGLNGLHRFDGISFAPVYKSDGTPAPAVGALLVSRAGDVWVGYSTGGSSVYRGGVLRDIAMPVTAYVMDLVQTPDGSIWATLGQDRQQLLRYQAGRWRDVSAQLQFPADQPIKMIVARDGTIWIATLKSVIFLPSGAPRFVKLNVAVVGHGIVAQDGQGNIWLSDEKGSRVIAPLGNPLIAPSPGRYPTPIAARKKSTLFDRDGNLWGNSDKGVFRVRTPRPEGETLAAAASASVTRYGEKNGLASDRPTVLLEDLEGNIWVASGLGLERFRAARVVVEPTMSKSAFYGDVLLRASDGTIYVGTADAIHMIRARAAPKILMSATEPQAMCEGTDGTIWIVLQDRIVTFRNGRFTSLAGPRDTEGKVADCAADRQGRIWIAATDRGLFAQIEGGWRQELPLKFIENYPPIFLLRKRDSGLLLGFESSSLAAFDPPALPRILAQPAAGLGPIRTALDTPRGLLVSGNFGLGLVRQDRFDLLPRQAYPRLGVSGGIVKSAEGRTWLSGPAAIIAVPTAALSRALDGARTPLPSIVLDTRDGLKDFQQRDSHRAAVQGGDGRIWFATGAGTVWIDPARLPYNRVPPPTAISALRADGVNYADPTTVKLAAGTSNFEIDFAAPSLSIPERVEVRYRLEGADRGWVDPDMRRQAFYTNLSPGTYVFRVIAANNDGVWNRTGATLTIEIPPTFLQSKWFVALCAIALAALLWCAYQLRIRQLRRKMRDMLEQRLAERERIARDLHDTLLQGFQGLILQFQSVANAIPRDQRAHHLIEQALDNADEVLSDGRASVQQLRAARVTDLAEAFGDLAERLRRDHPAQFDLVVEGMARELHPVVQEEACRIGDEALINAFRHANADRIEMVISYEASAFGLGIRDNGSGIAQEVLDRGRQGHFGLTGMRERADQIDADLSISSLPGSGTEIILTVPGRVAFASPKAGGSGSTVLRRLWRDPA